MPTARITAANRIFSALRRKLCLKKDIFGIISKKGPHPHGYGPFARQLLGQLPSVRLLDLDFGASLLELLRNLLGLVLGDRLFDLLRAAVDHVLGILEAETGDRADLLDDRDLVGASGLQDHVELGL